MNNDELMHYGVPGMKWGKRKANYYSKKAQKSRQSAKEWQQIGANKAKKYTNLAKKTNDKEWNEIASAKKQKYDKKAKQDLLDAKKYEQKSRSSLKKPTKKSVESGKKKAQQMANKTVKKTGKAISYGAQAVKRWHDNNVIMTYTELMSDRIYK